jgi:hypothetical protein
MILDIAKALSFFLSLLSLYTVLGSAFFIPGSGWEDRLVLALARIGLAGCICLLSGILFARPWQVVRGAAVHGSERLLATLPVRMYLYTVAGVAVLFACSWYFDVEFVPLLWRNLP